MKTTHLTDQTPRLAFVAVFTLVPGLWGLLLEWTGSALAHPVLPILNRALLFAGLSAGLFLAVGRLNRHALCGRLVYLLANLVVIAGVLTGTVKAFFLNPLNRILSADLTMWTLLGQMVSNLALGAIALSVLWSALRYLKMLRRQRDAQTPRV